MNASLNSPLKRSKRRSFGSVVGRLLATLVVLGLLGAGAAFFAWTAATIAGPLSETRIVELPDDASVADLAGKLVKEGVADSHLLTAAGIAALRYGLGARLKGGEYEFAAHSSLKEVLSKVRNGKRVFYKLSVPEGFTTWQVLERIRSNEVLTGDIEQVPTEGELLPDTYVFYRGRTRQSLIDQMKTAQMNLIEKLWPTRAEGLPFNSPEQALILASIVEKETGKVEERAHVAAVFINRLRRGMRLQSDPTIIYGITNGQGKLERPIYRSDIQKQTDYNTYRIDGLPPTPIANAGTAAIEAVLNPVETKDVFFVADGTGGHVFAETLEEHNANVKKWRSWLKDQREEQVAADVQAEVEAAQAEASNSGAPLPDVPQQQEQAPASSETAEPTQQPADTKAEEEPSSTFEVVVVAGRDVPIPKSKPALP